MKYLPGTNILCIEYNELVQPTGLVPKGTYDSWVSRQNIVRHTRGNNGSQVLVEWESLPEKIKAAYMSKFGDPYEQLLDKPLLALVKHDVQARNYYSDYTLPDGRLLPEKYQLRYCRQCDWLNMIAEVTADKKTLKDTLHITMDQFWAKVIRLHQVDKPINPELPLSYERLSRKLNNYKKGGYASLVEVSRFCNNNARKVDNSIERLLMALYCKFDKPTLVDVCREYNKFMSGEELVIDLETGEAFDPAKYLVNGQRYVVTPETVKHYINKPGNKIIVDSFRLSKKEFNDRHVPHTIRKAPFYAFSKITMDDTSSPFKMDNGDRPATYKVFDVASGALIWVVMHKESAANAPLIRRLLAEMMAAIVRNGWNMPYEIEVEHALNSGLKGKKKKGVQLETDVLTTGAVFPFVNFCAPRNPQEKRAEGFINAIKYTYQKHREGFQFRPFASRDSHRKNEDVKDRTYTLEEIYSMEMQDRELWNNSLHPDQEAYPGMTRWQVLMENQNPALAKPNLPLIMPYIGYKTKSTTLRRGRVQVQGGKYRLPNARVIEHLEDSEFTAYWLPEADGQISRVFLYQDGEFITEATYESAFQEARAEQTEEDLQILAGQRQYRDDFNEMVKEGRAALPRVGVIPAAAIKAPETEGEKAIAVPFTSPVPDPETGGYKGGYMQENGSCEGLYNNDESIKRRAIGGL